MVGVSCDGFTWLQEEVCFFMPQAEQQLDAKDIKENAVKMLWMGLRSARDPWYCQRRRNGDLRCVLSGLQK